MVTIAILAALVAALHIWIAEPNTRITVSLVKGLMFGFVFGSYDLYGEDKKKVKASHYQMSFAFIIITLEWYNEYE